MKNITLPAFDTPNGDMTPILHAAMEAGATVAAHPDDASKIIVTFTDEKHGKKFHTAVSPFLPVEEEPKVEAKVETPEDQTKVEPKAE